MTSWEKLAPRPGFPNQHHAREDGRETLFPARISGFPPIFIYKGGVKNWQGKVEPPAAIMASRHEG
jgi:hypothetical protein